MGSSLRTAVLLVPSAVAGSLSYWQLQRMRSKKAAVEQAREAMAAPPLDLTRADAANAAIHAGPHRRVAAEGRYLHGRSVFVGPRPLAVHPSEPAAQRRLRGVLSAPGSALKRGYLLVTPLELDHEDGEEVGRWGWFGGGKCARGAATASSSSSPPHVVLVNRGWVPPEWRDLWPLAFPDEGEELVSGLGSSSNDGEQQQKAASAAAAALRDAQPRGRVRVTGVAQPDETPSSFVPQNAARDRRHFFSVVASEIAEACGVWSSRPRGEDESGGGNDASSSSQPALAPPPPPPPLVQVCYDDSPGGGGVLDPEGRGERPTTRALPEELEAAARAGGGAAVAVGEAARERERRIAAAASAAPDVSVFPLPKPASGLARFSIMPEDHAGYAAMWGMMSAAMAALALRRPGVRRKGSGPV